MPEVQEEHAPDVPLGLEAELPEQGLATHVPLVQGQAAAVMMSPVGRMEC